MITYIHASQMLGMMKLLLLLCESVEKHLLM